MQLKQTGKRISKRRVGCKRVFRGFYIRVTLRCLRCLSCQVDQSHKPVSLLEPPAQLSRLFNAGPVCKADVIEISSAKLWSSQRPSLQTAVARVPAMQQHEATRTDAKGGTEKPGVDATHTERTTNASSDKRELKEAEIYDQLGYSWPTWRKWQILIVMFLMFVVQLAGISNRSG